MKSEIDSAIQLCEYIHEEALKQDEEFKKEMIAANKALQADGESGMVYHTRNLLNLLKEIKAK
tara:strand:+ start:2664 stop:2852 length:189 start_codon:yes stop_codon:yes gene_type:complete